MCLLKEEMTGNPKDALQVSVLLFRKSERHLERRRRKTFANGSEK